MLPSFRIWLTGSSIAWTLMMFSCATHKQVASVFHIKEKTLIGEFDKGWLRYKVYMFPATDQRTRRRAKAPDNMRLVLSIMIINMADGFSPLRKICANLEQYNIYYEYLLNQTKNDLVLLNGNNILYPVYYSFENNYNAFPFETINVGYNLPLTKHSRRTIQDARLMYLDKVFSHDTLLCKLSTKPL